MPVPVSDGSNLTQISSEANVTWQKQYELKRSKDN